MSSPKFQFEFSLRVLNHMGRGLYRNFATVIAEAVSNSWDAEATQVDIFIDKKRKFMSIKDNGKGMDASDFTKKFLNVGYSRREDSSNRSKRKVLGRKGIGKLALLSVSDEVAIYSKKEDSDEIGGFIDNGALDKQIKNDGKYVLGDVSKKIFGEKEKGTLIEFSGIKPNVNNPEVIKKYLAVLFNFSFSFGNEKFEIKVNGEKISSESLKELNENTQYLWMYGLEESAKKSLTQRFSKIEKEGRDLNALSFGKDNAFSIKGYIASVFIPRNLKIHGAGGFSAGLHLFVNGRLRQEDIFKDLYSHRVIESYLYGEIHVDALDRDGDEDIFTSNREGIMKDDLRYKQLMEALLAIQNDVFKEWEDWRREKKALKNKKYGRLQSSKKKAIDKFLSLPEDEDWKEAFKERFLPAVIPEPSNKHILISHSSDNKDAADIIYQLLLFCGYQAHQILYTSSDNLISRVPSGEDIFEYIREFFVQNWWNKPPVFFVLSNEYEQSWFASLEAGATWVTLSDHLIMVLDGYRPKDPLNPGRRIYLNLPQGGRGVNSTTFYQIFNDLHKQINGGVELNRENFENKLRELLEGL